MFQLCETPSYYGGSHTSVTSQTTGEDCRSSAIRFQVTYSAGGPPTAMSIQLTTTVVPDFEVEIPTPWVRKGALYQRMPKVKDVWRAKWRLSQQRPRGGLHHQQ